jgi:DNA replication protein DnaC
MDKDLESNLNYLRLTELRTTWDEVVARAKRENPSYTGWLKQIIDGECRAKRERARMQRMRRAQIEESFLIETYPFNRQPALNKKRVLELFDSQSVLAAKKDVVFMGPTGAGKTGLATALLIDAINKGHGGRFITFPELLNEMYRAVADHSEQKVMKKFTDYQCLVIDEVGYIEINPDKAGFFFALLKKRHRKATTIVTTQLGFSEWASFLKNPQLTAALIDRLKSNADLINMNKCTSLRLPSPETKTSGDQPLKPKRTDR